MSGKQRETEYNFKKRSEMMLKERCVLVWLGELWIPRLGVCKRAEKPVLTREQGRAF